MTHIKDLSNEELEDLKLDLICSVGDVEMVNQAIEDINEEFRRREDAKLHPNHSKHNMAH